MSYTGQDPEFSVLDTEQFSGDNTTTQFPLKYRAGGSSAVDVYVDNQWQKPSEAYTVSGSTLSFTEAPETGTNNIFVRYRAIEGSTQYAQTTEVQPDPNSVAKRGANGEIKATDGSANDDALTVNQLGASAVTTKDVSQIDADGVLTITPQDGRYITLTGHGAADVEITGFGNQLPVGYEFELIIPRTLPDTGNTANTLGNFVQLTHTAGVDGIDMTMNKRVINGSPLFNYQAYPNVSDADGNACNLAERVKFIQTSQANGGRASLVGLSSQLVGQNTDGSYKLSADGSCILTKDDAALNHATTNTNGVMYRSGAFFQSDYPIKLFGASRSAECFVKSAAGATTGAFIGKYAEIADTYLSIMFYSTLNRTYSSIPITFSVTGYWKPQV